MRGHLFNYSIIDLDGNSGNQSSKAILLLLIGQAVSVQSKFRLGVWASRVFHHGLIKCFYILDVVHRIGRIKEGGSITVCTYSNCTVWL